MNFFKIEKKRIGENNPAFIIAEIGLNHNGSSTQCAKLIDQAKLAGADAVKLQVSKPEESYAKTTSSYKIFKKNLLKKNEIYNLKKYAEKRNITFFLWGAAFVLFLQRSAPSQAPGTENCRSRRGSVRCEEIEGTMSPVAGLRRVFLATQRTVAGAQNGPTVPGANAQPCQPSNITPGRNWSKPRKSHPTLRHEPAHLTAQQPLPHPGPRATSSNRV